MKGLRLLTAVAFVGVALGTAAPASAGDPGNARTLFDLTNQDRTSNGLGALAYNGTLSSIATSAHAGSCGGPNGRSQDMIDRNYFSHQIPPCGSYVWQVFNLGAYTAAGENIGWNNYPPPQSVGQINTAFMNSPEHRANILGNYNQLGTGAWAATGRGREGAPPSTARSCTPRSSSTPPRAGGAATTAARRRRPRGRPRARW